MKTHGFSDGSHCLPPDFSKYPISVLQFLPFQVFDRLLLLKKGGQTVYFGSLGKNCRTLIGYFEKSGGRQCDPSENLYVFTSFIFSQL